MAEREVEILTAAYEHGAIVYSGPEGTILADAGDVLLAIQEAESRSFVTMSPDEAITVVEKLLDAAEKGRAIKARYEEEIAG